MTEPPLAYLPTELQPLLKVSRHQAYRIANQIGIRISVRRIIVPRAALEEFLKNGKTRD